MERIADNIFDFLRESKSFPPISVRLHQNLQYFSSVLIYNQGVSEFNFNSLITNLIQNPGTSSIRITEFNYYS